MIQVGLFEKGSAITPLDTDAINEYGEAINVLGNLTINPPGLATIVYSDEGVAININGIAFQEVVEDGVISTFFVAKRTGPVA